MKPNEVTVKLTVEVELHPEKVSKDLLDGAHVWVSDKVAAESVYELLLLALEGHAVIMEDPSPEHYT
jgi:hypothetical protein